MSALASIPSVTGGMLRRRSLALACATLAAGLTSLAVQAQPRDERHGRPGQRPAPRPAPHFGARPHRQPSRPMRGSGPDRRWHKGDRVPPAYRSRHYVVSNWRAHHLSPPPRGYHWVQYGSDYMLVAIASGVIAQLILSQ